MLGHKSNYFIGNDPSEWQTNVPSYSQILYKNIYPGIDLKYYSNGGSLKYDLIKNKTLQFYVIFKIYQNRVISAVSNFKDKKLKLN